MKKMYAKRGGIYALTALLWVGLCGYFVFEYRQIEHIYEKEQINNFIGSYRSTYKGLEGWYNLFFETTIDKSDVKSILQRAVSDTKNGGKLREALFWRLKPEFEKLQKLGFENIALTFADGTVFLRMNDPGLYGDRIDEKRPLVAKVKQTGRYESGFEVGKLASGFTFCHPLIFEGKVVGMVFSSISAKSFAGTMNQDLSGKFAFIINKTKIDATMSTKSKTTYPISYISDDFYRDDSFDLDSKNGSFAKKVRQQTSGVDLMEYKARVLRISIDDIPSTISLLPIKMSNDEYGAYFVHLDSDVHHISTKNELFVKLIVTTALFGVLTAVFRARQRLDDELVQSEEEHRMLFEHAAVGFCYIQENGNILNANEKMCEMLRYGKEELLHKSFSSLIHQDEFGLLTGLFNASPYGSDYVYSRRHRCIKKDGTNIWVNLTACSFGIASNEKAIIATIEDISEKIEIDYRFERQSIQMKAIVDGVPSMIFIKDFKHNWVFGNKAFCDFLGRSFEELYGKSDDNFLPDSEARRVWEDDDRVIGGEALIQYEEFLTNWKGERRVFMTSKFPFRLLDGSKGLLGVATDITEKHDDKQKIAEQGQFIVAQSRFAAMGEMIGMIAHQWRQPITAIGMAANNMTLDIDMGEIDADTFRKHLESIGSQVQFLSHTIDDFRNFFKPNTESSLVKVGKIIKGALSIIGKSLENRDIALVLESSEDEGECSCCDTEIEVYEGELVQAILVFLGNAKDALTDAENPMITIGCERLLQEESVEIRVCDNGGGVPEGLMQKIFEPYFTTKEAKNGTGLGLYIAKTIVEKYQGGSIGVENKNGGACFWIKLPIKSTDGI